MNGNLKNGNENGNHNLHIDFSLKECLFGAFKQNRNTDSDKNYDSGYDTRFDEQSRYLIPSFYCAKNAIIFCV